MMALERQRGRWAQTGRIMMVQRDIRPLKVLNIGRRGRREAHQVAGVVMAWKMKRAIIG